MLVEPSAHDRQLRAGHPVPQRLVPTCLEIVAIAWILLPADGQTFPSSRMVACLRRVVELERVRVGPIAPPARRFCMDWNGNRPGVRLALRVPHADSI